MTKAEKRHQRLKERLDLNSQIRAQLDKKFIFICNPTRKTFSHGVELNNMNWFRYGWK